MRQDGRGANKWYLLKQATTVSIWSFVPLDTLAISVEHEPQS